MQLVSQTMLRRAELFPTATRAIGVGPKSTTNPNPGRRNSERQAQIQQRSIGTDVHAFDVHAWGGQDKDPATDYAITNALRECLRAALHDLGCGATTEDAGTWDDETERATQLIKSGHLLTFNVTISVPITDNPLVGGLPFIPIDSTFEVTVQSPTPEVAATFDLTGVSPG